MNKLKSKTSVSNPNITLSDVEKSAMDFHNFLASDSNLDSSLRVPSYSKDGKMSFKQSVKIPKSIQKKIDKMFK